MLPITPEYNKSFRFAGDTVGKGDSNKQSYRQQAKLTGRRSPCEAGRGFKRTRTIASHDAPRTLSITPECSNSCRVAGDTVGKGYSSKQSSRQQAKLAGRRSPCEARRGLQKNASDGEP